MNLSSYSPRLSAIAATAAFAGAGLAGPAVAAATARSAHHRLSTQHKSSGHHGARTFTFRARVVRSGPTGLLVRRSNGKTVFLAARSLAHRSAKKAGHSTAARHHSGVQRGRLVLAHAANTSASTPPVSVNIVGLQPGVTVLVTETVNPDGSVSITITLPPAGSTGEQSATGVVGDVGNDTFDVQTSDGSDLRLHMAADALAALNLQSCDQVSLTYHQDSSLLIADTVKATGSSTSGDCQPTSDAVGTITAVSGSALTVHTDTGSMSFTVDDSSITDGYLVGDVVDVTYVQNSDGSLTAQDVEYDQQDASGTVTAVSKSKLAITDSATGATDTFAADPSSGVSLDGTGFDGVQVGDQVDVSYHVSNNQMVADDVSDNGAGGSSADGSSGGDASGGSNGDSSGGSFGDGS